MENWSIKKMVSNLRDEASKRELNIELGKEDGFTWVTLWGTEAKPENFDALSAMVAESTGRDFYARSAGVDSICGALDADPAADEDAEPFHYLKRHISSYGRRFEPSPSARKHRRSDPTAEERALAEVFSGPCDASAQSRAEELLSSNPRLASARMESVVWEVQGRRGPEERTPPLWWAALAGADPEGWSSWMSVADSEIGAQALIDKAGKLDEPSKRLKALGEFGIKPHRRSFT